MKKLIALSALVVVSVASLAQSTPEAVADTAKKQTAAAEPMTKKEKVVAHFNDHFKLYGFVRDYLSFDTRESKAGTLDEFYYLPKDYDWNEDKSYDKNEQISLRYLAITTRLGLDVKNYQVGRTQLGAKIEGDFFCLNGTTATLRLRHAYATMAWDSLPIAGGKYAKVQLLMGQNWHPISTGSPDDISFNYGAPFNAYNRSPQITLTTPFDKRFSLVASLIWQMQYQCTGPEGNSVNYMKYACTPEAFIGFGLRQNGWEMNIGADVVSIKPRRYGFNADSITVPVSDRITTINPCIYVGYVHGNLAVRAKSVPYSSGGEHIYMMSGYGVTNKDNADGHYDYTPLHCSSTWLSILYGKKWQGGLFLGYIENLGSSQEVLSAKDVYFNSNGFINMNRMYRVVPSVRYNIGKFTIALQYHYTAVQYGDKEEGFDTKTARYLSGLHYVGDHRCEMMFKFAF